jgi:Flp pilus assembly protein TadB
MHPDEPRARIGHEGGAISRAKQWALKVFLVVASAATLVSAFLLSLVFVAIGLAVVLTVGGFLWWKTRELRRQIRTRMRGEPWPAAEDRVIEGEVISREPTRR